MFKLVKMEFKRLLYAKSFYATILGYGICFLIGATSIIFSETKSFTLADIMSKFTLTYFLFAIFLVIFVAGYIRIDFHCGQIKNIVSATTDRGSFIKLKYVTMTIFVTIMSVLSIGGLMVVTLIIPGKSLVLGDVTNYLVGLVQYILMCMFLVAVVILLAIIFRHEMFSILLGIVLAVIWPMGLQFTGPVMGFELSKASVLVKLLGFEGGTAIRERLIYAGLAIAYTVIAMIVAKIIMRRKDVHI